VLPLPQVLEVIDGAGPGHGSREMPIWGTEYGVRAAGYDMDVPCDSAAFVRARWRALAKIPAKQPCGCRPVRFWSSSTRPPFTACSNPLPDASPALTRCRTGRLIKG
jgi:hypothetical protein